MKPTNNDDLKSAEIAAQNAHVNRDNPYESTKAAEIQCTASFRAHLQMIVGTDGDTASLAALPGPSTSELCAQMAQLPNDVLAFEFAAPVRAILRQIDKVTARFGRPLLHNQIQDPALRARYEQIVWQLDLALSLILRQLAPMLHFRATFTQCSDLLVETLGFMTKGAEAARFVRRWENEFGNHDEPDEDPGAVPANFASDTYARVQALDDFADAFPESVRIAAREMHGWPMLVHRHRHSRERFEELAERLQLGADHPFDTSKNAHFHPDSPMVRYLNRIVSKLDHVWLSMRDVHCESGEEENKRLRILLFEAATKWPSAEEIAIARVAIKLPPLTKATAGEWVDKAIVPFIMATDAHDWKHCTEPALEQIARQKTVKSESTFKWRLRSAIASTLRAMAKGKSKPNPRKPRTKTQNTDTPHSASPADSAESSETRELPPATEGPSPHPGAPVT